MNMYKRNIEGLKLLSSELRELIYRQSICLTDLASRNYADAICKYELDSHKISSNIL